MSAPWSVELKKNVLVVLHDELIVVLCYNDSDWALLFLGNRLALDARFDLASYEVFDELANLLLAKLFGISLRLVWELLVLRNILNSESWPFANFKVEIATMLTERLGVDCSEINLTLVLLSNRPEAL
jgi:hypothetical protein